MIKYIKIYNKNYNILLLCLNNLNLLILYKISILIALFRINIIKTMEKNVICNSCKKELGFFSRTYICKLEEEGCGKKFCTDCF